MPRADESCAADWIRRVWVYGDPDSSLGVSRLIRDARSLLADELGWTEGGYASSEELDERKEALEPVAVYSGHIFDVYLP